MVAFTNCNRHYSVAAGEPWAMPPRSTSPGCRKDWDEGDCSIGLVENFKVCSAPVQWDQEAGRFAPETSIVAEPDVGNGEAAMSVHNQAKYFNSSEARDGLKATRPYAIQQSTQAMMSRTSHLGGHVGNKRF